MRKALLAAGLALILAACAALPSPVVRPTGRAEPVFPRTVKPRSARTHIPTTTPEPTETALAIFPSATPELALSLTPTALLLPTPSETAAPTLIVDTATPTALGRSALDCELIWQSPANGARYTAGKKFSVGWNIKNIGTVTWETGSFEFTYLDGAKLYPGDRIPLAESVAPGETVVLSVPMKAPRNPNMYTTYWGIRQGDAFFCRLKLTIWVR